MQKIKIEKNVPIPPSRGGSAAGKNGFLMQMRVGDSVLLDVAEHNRVRGSIQYFQIKNPGVKFTTRQANGQIRVWRVA